MNKVFLMLILLVLIITGCTNDSPLAPDKELIVVRGYLYAGEPVTDIKLTSTLTLGSEDTLAPPINNAQVALLKAGQRYELASTPGDSGFYHYAGTDLEVKTGDEFQIEVQYNNQSVTAATIVPAAPQGVTISKSTLSFPDFDTLWELRQQGISMDSIRNAMTLSVNWEQAPDALYFIVVKNVDANPVEVESNFNNRRPPRAFISQPVATDEYTVNAMMMTHLGKHLVKVYRVNQEYADLYQSRNQDSRDLNEPLTNIINGLGVFSAFNSDSVYFDFKK
ncbi:DUF4249 domain-containing protein [candidate division KSB1 bacterium]|nr:DUF4249 domain-containing protein [candidate division KSB1 bacterium]